MTKIINYLIVNKLHLFCCYKNVKIFGYNLDIQLVEIVYHNSLRL